VFGGGGEVWSAWALCLAVRDDVAVAVGPRGVIGGGGVWNAFAMCLGVRDVIGVVVGSRVPFELPEALVLHSGMKCRWLAGCGHGRGSPCAFDGVGVAWDMLVLHSGRKGQWAGRGCRVPFDGGGVA
jgi:hypothetical protein